MENEAHIIADEQVPWGTYMVISVDEESSEIKQLCGESLGEKWVTLGVIKGEREKGKEVFIYVAPDTDVKF